MKKAVKITIEDVCNEKGDYRYQRPNKNILYGDYLQCVGTLIADLGVELVKSRSSLNKVKFEITIVKIE